MIQAFDFNGALCACNELSAKQYSTRDYFGFITLNPKVLVELEQNCAFLNEPPPIDTELSLLMKMVAKNRSENLSKSVVLPDFLPEQIREMWKTKRNMLLCSSKALSLIANQYLVQVVLYYNLAKNELAERGGKLPEHFRSCFSQYVEDLDGQIQTLRRQICWAMLARLRVADDSGDLKCDDILYYFSSYCPQRNQLDRHTVNQALIRKKLTKSEFVQFARYIKKFGSEEQLNELHQLSWLRPAQNYIEIVSFGNSIWVPKKFDKQKLIPTHVYFKRLAPWAHFRSIFFSENMRLLAQLRRFAQDVDGVIVADFTQLHQHIQLLKKTEEQLQQLDRQCEQRRPGGILKYLNRKMLMFTSNWRQYSAQQHAILQQVKINTLEKFCQQLSKRYEKNESGGCEVSCKELHRVKKIIQESYFASDVVKCRLKINRCAQIIDDLLERFDVKVNIDELENEISSTLDGSQQKSLGMLATVCELNVFTLKNNDFQIVKEKVSTAKKHLGGCDNLQLREAMEKYDTQLFVNYLKACWCLAHNVKNTLLVERIIAVEDILKESMCEHITLRVRELSNLRLNPDKAYIFGLKCSAFLKSYGEAMPEVSKPSQVIIQDGVDLSGLRLQGRYSSKKTGPITCQSVMPRIECAN